MNAPFHPEQAEKATISASPPGVPGLRPRHRAYAVVAVVAVLGIGWKVFHHPAATPPAMGPVPVEVAQPLVRDVTEWDDYVGRFAPSQAVEIRPRVSGAITAIHFTDGALVQKGQALFTVDPRPYQAALAEARANAASAASSLALARADYARVTGLGGDEAVAATEVDARRARLQAAQATLAAAQARVRARALDMEFTVVRAPISGRVSNRRVDIGNLVSGDNAANATLLTTINATDPIYFTFDASEALFLKARRDAAAHAAPPQVEVRLADETDYRWKGKLDFTDNGLDPRSGTIRLRATFANGQGFLTPGLFGNLRLSEAGKHRALLVPDAAILSDQARKVVLVLGKDGTASMKPVEPGALVDGLRVIRSGLTPGDTVVLSNTMAAASGAKLAPHAGHITPTPPPPREAGPSGPSAAQATLAN